MFYKLINTLDKYIHFPVAKAHCDVPCGIYDPISAQIDALTVVRMMDLMDGLASGEEKSRKDVHNSMSRYIAVKEEHAEKAKHEIRIIHGDFKTPEYAEKFKGLPAAYKAKEGGIAADVLMQEINASDIGIQFEAVDDMLDYLVGLDATIADLKNQLAEAKPEMIRKRETTLLKPRL